LILLNKLQFWKQQSFLDKDEKANLRKRLQQDINGRFQIIVEPSLCLAFGSCETLAPRVFVVEKNKFFNPKAKVISETGEDFDSVLAAAKTCPTKAISIIDKNTGECIYP
jgi:ferredoxin